MSSHRKHLTISQPLKSRDQRPRGGRHGKEHMRRERHVVQDADGKISVQHEWVPVTAPYAMNVAAGPTEQRGRVNGGGGKQGELSGVPAWWGTR